MLTDQALRESAQYMVDRIKKICQDFGPRRPGSEGEKKCQEFLYSELSDAGFDPEIESFPVSQTAFMAAPIIAGWLAVIAIPFFWIDPGLSTGLLALSLGVFLAEVGAYRHILTPLFPTHTSYNVYAKLAPTGPIKRRIILAGHADAACEWVYQERFPEHFMKFGIAAFASIAYLFLTSLAVTIFTRHHPPAEGFWWWVGASQWLALPGALIAATFTRFSVVAPGAVDNLSGALMSVALARQFRQSGINLENTEVIFMVTGSEEAGLVGAEAYALRHKHEWNDVETVFVALESFRELEHLMVYDRDMNSRVHHNPRACMLFQYAMRKCGIDHKFGAIPVGSTDASATTRLGIPSTALVGMNPAPAHYYHCRRDSWEILDEECLFKTAQVICTALEDFDKNGLPNA